MKAIIALLLMLFGLQSQAQEISGRILDEKKEPLPSAVIQVYQNGILKGGNVTDYDGNYSVKPLDPGYYDMQTLYPGCDSIMVTGVVVLPGQRTIQNFTMLQHIVGQKGIVVTAYKGVLVNRPVRNIAEDEPVRNICCGYIIDPVAYPNTYQQQRGKSVNIGGVRSTGVLHTLNVAPVLSAIISNIKRTTPTSFGFLTREQLDQMPWTNVRDLAALFPGVYQVRSGDEVSIFGSRMR